MTIRALIPLLVALLVGALAALSLTGQLPDGVGNFLAGMLAATVLWFGSGIALAVRQRRASRG
jgi:hypothetical protein